MKMLGDCEVSVGHDGCVDVVMGVEGVVWVVGDCRVVELNLEGGSVSATGK